MRPTSGWLPSVMAVACLGLASAFPLKPRWTDDRVSQRYCAARAEGACCPGRNDSCTAPIRDSLCYCDSWCRLHTWEDCCPDFEERACDAMFVEDSCSHGGRSFEVGARMKQHCNTCECSRRRDYENNRIVVQWKCTNEACIIEDSLIKSINERNVGWTAASYDEFFDMSLEYGVKYLLGTRPPAQMVSSMHPIGIPEEEYLPRTFDSRTAWPEGYIRPPRDQGKCGSSWAIAAADVLADRLSLLSNGTIRMALSAQQLISCVQYDHGCGGGEGRVEEAFSYMSGMGLVAEDCYRYDSGRTSQRHPCRIWQSRDNREAICPSTGRLGILYRSTPAYRISTNERDIMNEIRRKGPVLAIMEVRPDFYVYRAGVYRSTGIPESEGLHDHSKAGYHAVRIIGWGEENRAKYWLVANSWGKHWGVDGTFKILRGVNESAIESFVVGVWGGVDPNI